MSFNFIQSAIAAAMPAARATGLFAVTTITFQAPDGILGPSGAPSGVYADVAGLVAIPCMNAPQPPTDARFGVMESRTATEVTPDARRNVLLDDYFPSVVDNWRYGLRAVMDGINYNIAGAESDSQHTQTRVLLELVTFGAVQA